MSNNIDINQLLEEIGASDRSADDPWTLSSNARGMVPGPVTSPAVMGDLGAPMENLTSEMQSSERITYADTIASSPTGGTGTASSSSGGGGLLGGLLNFFPLASGVAELFGFGGSSSSPPALTPYQLPPSVNFEGAMTSPTSGVTSLSYGANGLPRTSGTAQIPAAVLNTANSSFTSAPTEALADVAGQSPEQSASVSTGSTSANIIGQLGSLAQGDFANTPAAAPAYMADPSTTDTALINGSATNVNMATQLGALTNSTFATEPSGSSPMPSSDWISNSNGQNPGDNSSSSASPSAAAPASNSSGTASTSGQQGQSILVQVQAMDSQSFMDHSQDIAQAVRQAMLNLHSVNDVILDL